MRSFLERYFRHRFAWLFCSLLLTIGMGPVLEILLPFNPLEWLLAVNLIAAIASAVHERWFRVLGWVGIGYLAARGLAEILGYPSLHPIGQLAWLLTALVATVATARYALRGKNVKGDHLFAALDTYLLVGLVFGVGYSLLDRIAPGSFGSPLESNLTLARGVYFSFVTLATLGYGDIVPVSDIARGIVILEAVTGQLYLAVLVARLLALYGKSS